MNSFGRNFRVQILGESHGSVIGVLLDGVPSGIKISEKDFVEDLIRRNPKSYNLGATKREEQDIVTLKTGVFNNKTTGAPLLLEVYNNDKDSSCYEQIKNIPRPGHADFVANQKYNSFNDYRGGAHFSGRVTVGLVLAGVIAKKIIKYKKLNIETKAQLSTIKGSDLSNIKKVLEQAINKNDSVGGEIICRINSIPIGLGEPFFNSFESLIAHVIFSVPGVKGIEFGSGFEGCKMYGSEFNDEFFIDKNKEYKTISNNSGGINGGVSNGNEVYFKLAIRPTPSIEKLQKSVNLKTKENTTIMIKGRHDTCFAQRVPVIVEAATNMVIADLLGEDI